MRIPIYHAGISVIIHVLLVSGLLAFTNLGIYALLIGNITIDGNNSRIYGSSNIFLGLGNNNYISFNNKNISIDKPIVISEDIVSHDYV